MATRHILICPNCDEELLVDVETAMGGTVQDNLVIIDHRHPAVAAAPDASATVAVAPDATLESGAATPDPTVAPADVNPTPVEDAPSA